MTTETDVKSIVRDRYNQIANQDKRTNQSSCCGCGGGSGEVYNIMTDDYSGLEGYAETADLGLGCGLPTQFAQIEPGDTVVDLGSGAGNDCFVARHETGAGGRVIGIDFAPNMLEKARANAAALGFDNVEFRAGDIEAMPLADNSADVIVSNCVLNLVPDKPRVFREIFRVLKPGGHFSISDVVLIGELPAALRENAEMYVGCVAGAILKGDYLDAVEAAGFADVTLQKEKPIALPADILGRYLSPGEVQAYRDGAAGIVSITLFARKPGAAE